MSMLCFFCLRLSIRLLLLFVLLGFRIFFTYRCEMIGIEIDLHDVDAVPRTQQTSTIQHFVNTKIYIWK